MTVTCPGCHSTLTIPDDRLPKGKVVNAACPRCKGTISIDARTPPSPATQPDATPGVRPPEETASYEELGQPKALVCVNDASAREQIASLLRAHGFAPQTASSPSQSMERLRFAAYSLVVVQEGFDGEAAAGGLADTLAEMPMSSRRNLHVVLISPGVTSLDAPSAFARSVDVVLHPSDLSRLGDALKRSQTERDRIYRVFRESLTAMERG